MQQIALRPLATLIPYARNSRTHSEAQVAQIAASLDAFGMVGAIVVRDGVIAKGHGTLAAIRQLQQAGKRLYPAPGREAGAQPFDDGLCPVLDVSGWSEAQFRAYVIADNRLAELAGWDVDLLRLELDALDADGFDLDLTGFDAVALENLLPMEGGHEATQANARASLAERFLLAPFTVLNARDGNWQTRKRAWLGLGLCSELGRANGLAFADSAQPPEVYQAKNAYEAKLGRTVSWQDFLAANPEARSQAGTSIFDPVLCELVYRWFCPEGGVVLDPFAGGSVRGIVAAWTDRQYVGCELREEQVTANRQQWQALDDAQHPAPVWHCGDSRQIARHAPDVVADLLFSCPPYADLEVYSDDPADLSTLAYPDFVAAYRDIIAASLALLKPDRFACFVVGDVRDGRGLYRNFVSDTVAAFQDAGARLYNEAILVTQAGSLAIRVGKQFTHSRKLGKTHQNVLVFVKGDPRRATEACGPVVVDDSLFAEAVA